MSVRSFVFMAIAGVAGCASAIATDVQPDGTKGDPPDATAGGHLDAPNTTHPDAPDVPTDAPVAQGTCTHAVTGVLATFSFTGATGSQASTIAASSAVGMTVTAVTRAPTLAVASGQNSINSSGWATTTTRDSAKYYTVTITPGAGCKLDLTGAAIDAKASSSGPASATLATSVDTFAQSTTMSTAVASTPSLAITNATGAIEIRIYGYAATSASGTFRLQNTLTISGSLH